MSAEVVLYWDPTNEGRISCANHGSQRLESVDQLTAADLAYFARTGDPAVCEDAARGGCGGTA